MRLEVAPLMEAIEKYIAKANDDLKSTLEEEGFAAAGTAARAINEIEDEVADALNQNTDMVVNALSGAESIEEFLSSTWGELTDQSQLKEALREIFHRQFMGLVEEFTYNWLIDASHEMAEIFTESPAISAPTYDFISSWSRELSEMMRLTTDNMMEKILRTASDEQLSIEQVTTLIEESGIREPGYRARRVATTEVLRLESYSQIESMQQNPLAYKKRWIHRISENPRENHMAIHGQEVFKREPFTLIGRDGVTYYPQCPRDTSLPASESVNCHCTMETVADDSAIGMSKDELAELRERALDEVNAEWASSHASDKVNVILSMNEQDQIRYFGGRNDGKARLALVKSGVVDTDEKLRDMYKTDANGRPSLKSLQELADGGIFTVSDDRLRHSAVGDYVRPSRQYPTGRMISGGHGQAAMSMCDEKDIEYSVTKTLSNGVRIGNVPSSGMGRKMTGDGQLWFPESWDEEKIRLAGTVVANSDGEWIDGYRKTGVYDGVAVQVILTKGNIGTVCPDYDQDKYVKGVS